MRKARNQNIVKLLHQAEELELKGIHLLESHCKLGRLKKGELPRKATQEVQIAIQIDTKARLTRIVASYKLVVTYEDSTAGDQPLLLGARFGLNYALGGKHASSKVSEEAVQHAAVTTSWPYWRELAQSLTVRMGLPAFPVPPISPIEFTKSHRKIQKP